MPTPSFVHAIDQLDNGADVRPAHLTGIAVLVTAVVAAIVSLRAGLWFRATVIAGATAPLILGSMLFVDALLRRRD